MIGRMASSPSLLMEAATQNLSDAAFFTGDWLRVAQKMTPYKQEVIAPLRKTQAELAPRLIWC
jgi:hypothetical protein